MSIDPSIPLGIRPQPDSLEQYGKVLGIKTALGQQELQGMQIEHAARELRNAKLYDQAAQESGGDLGAMSKRLMDLGHAEGAIKVSVANTKALKDRADYEKTEGEVNAQRMKQFQDSWGDVKTPEQAREHAIAEHNDPRLGAVLKRHGITLDQSLAQIPADPAQFQQYIAQKNMGMTKFIEQSETARHHGATETQGAASLAETTRHHAAIEGDPKMIEDTAQAIAAGRLAPLSGFALARPSAQNIMARVVQINPDFDPTQFQTRQKSEKDFATGKQGNTVRSFNVALAHLDTLDKLSDALKNKDTQLINRIGNEFAAQTGSAAPVNFDAAKKIVADEIVKAIIGSGGGVTDREEAAKTVSRANSPEQLKGVIATYKELMRGQIGGLRQQYESTTGKQDFDTKYLSESGRQTAHAPTKSTPGNATGGIKFLGWEK
jgi:hypothetical protein